MKVPHPVQRAYFVGDRAEVRNSRLPPQAGHFIGPAPGIGVGARGEGHLE